MPTTVPRRPSQATYPHESTRGCRVGAAETIWVNACAKHEPIDGRVVTEYEERLHISCRGFAQQQRASHSWPRTTHHPSSLHSSCRTVSALYWRLSLHDGDAPPCFGHGTSTASLVAASSSKGKPDRLVPPFPPPVAVVVAKGGHGSFAITRSLQQEGDRFITRRCGRRAHLGVLVERGDIGYWGHGPSLVTTLDIGCNCIPLQGDLHHGSRKAPVDRRCCGARRSWPAVMAFGT